MSLTRKQLKELKEKLTPNDRNALNKVTSTTRHIKQKIKKEGFSNKKSIVRWNYEVNELVKLTYSPNMIGLIISDFEYFSTRVEKNCFFILVENSVKQIDGRYLRRL